MWYKTPTTTLSYSTMSQDKERIEHLLKDINDGKGSDEAVVELSNLIIKTKQLSQEDVGYIVQANRIKDKVKVKAEVLELFKTEQGFFQWCETACGEPTHKQESDGSVLNTYIFKNFHILVERFQDNPKEDNLEVEIVAYSPSGVLDHTTILRSIPSSDVESKRLRIIKPELVRLMLDLAKEKEIIK